MATITVKKSGGNHNTITKAVNAAKTGDTIIVYAGVYKEQIRIHTSGLTIKANSGDHVEVSGGIELTNRSNPNPGTAGYYPTGSYTNNRASTDGAGYKWDKLVLADASDIIWDGIDIVKGLGRGFQTGTDNRNINYKNITVKNCEIHSHRGSGAHFMWARNVRLENVTFHHNVCFYLGDNVSSRNVVPGSYGNHPGTLSFKGCNDTIIKGCNFYHNGGETVMLDSNMGGSTRFHMERTTISDGKEVVFYMHAASEITINRCTFYTSEDRDIWVSNGHTIGFRGIMQRAVESETADRLHGTVFGIQNVKFSNCLFVNTGQNAGFGSNKIVANNGVTYLKNIKYKGCTFVQTKPHYNLMGQRAIQESGNLFEGCIFYASGAGKMINGSFPSSGYTFKNNMWNNSPGSQYVVNGSVVANPKLNNPTAIIHRNGIDLNNYKLLAGSPAINKWSGHGLVDDGFGGARGSITDYGFHDTEATGAPPVSTSPNASFSMSAYSVKPGVEVTLNDTSTPSSGQSITSRNFVVTLPGTSENFQGTTTPFKFTPAIKGDYTITLTVAQGNGKSSAISKSLIVSDDDVPPPPSGCDTSDFSKWSSAIKSGNPTLATLVSGERSIECPTSEDQGWWYSYWGGNVNPGDHLDLQYDVKGTLESGNINVFILYYSGDTLLGNPPSESFSPTSEYKSYKLSSVVPATATKARVDIRMWGAVGKIYFKNVCLGAPGSVSARITAMSGGSAVSHGGSVENGEDVIFDGSSSDGTGKSYSWRVLDGSGHQVGEATTGATLTKRFDTIGSYSAELTVTAGDENSVALFRFSVVNDVSTELSVSFILDSGEISVSKPESFQVEFDPHFTAPDGISVDAYKWEILASDNTTVLNTINNNGAASPTFPLAGVSDRVYGMRLTAHFSSGASRAYVKYRIITVEPIPAGGVIGPPNPSSVGHGSQNVIHSDGSHTHEIATDLDGRAGSVPIIDHFGVLYIQRLNLGRHDADTPHTRMLGPVRLSLDGDILLINGGKISGPEVIFDSQNIVTPNLPTHDPHVKGQWWLDAGKIAVSSG